MKKITPVFNPSKINTDHLRPKKNMVSRAEARAWHAGDVLRLRKYDGEFSAVPVAGRGVVLAEHVRYRSGGFYTPADYAALARWPGGFWAAFTVAEVDGQNVLHLSTSARHDLLVEMARDFAPDMFLAEVTDIDTALASGGEGVCAFPWSARWGEMLCHKANEIFLCRVTRHGHGQSVTIADATTGEERGAVPLRGGKCDQVRAGSIIRVEGMGLTAAGKIRQPVPCREWLVTF